MNDSTKSNIKIAIAELIGTFILVLVACGVAVLTKPSTSNSGGIIATALAFGLCIVAVAYTIGAISGAHVNPAVSLAFAFNKRISWIQFCFYVGGQIIGAILGSVCLFLILALTNNFENTKELIGTLGLGQNDIIGASGSVDNWKWGPIVSSILIEVVLTFIFVLVILCVTRSGSEFGKKAGLIIGLVLVLVHLIGIPLTGTSVNPARSLAPALLMCIANTGYLCSVWVFIVGPLAGAILAALVSKYFFKYEK